MRVRRSPFPYGNRPISGFRKSKQPTVCFDHIIQKVVQINLTEFYDLIMEKGNKAAIYTKEEIRAFILDSSKTKISDVAVHKRINKMIALGRLSRIGNGQYTFASKPRFDYELASSASLEALHKLDERFGKGVRFVVYESTLLNRFLNHLIARPTVIAEVEKDLAETVFWFLKENGAANVLLNPSENENYFYNPYDGSGIIVKAMVSKSPIDEKNHKITIEKLVVDIVADKTLHMFYEGAEVPRMVEDILKDYAVKLDSVRNYAKRRHCLDRFANLVPEDLKEAFYD